MARTIPGLPDASASRQEDFATARAERCRQCCSVISRGNEPPAKRTSVVRYGDRVGPEGVQTVIEELDAEARSLADDAEEC